MKHHTIHQRMSLNWWFFYDYQFGSRPYVLYMNQCSWCSVDISGPSAQNRWPRGAEGSAGWQLSDWRHANLPENARHFKCADILDKKEADCLVASACAVCLMVLSVGSSEHKVCIFLTQIYLTISVSLADKAAVFQAMLNMFRLKMVKIIFCFSQNYTQTKAPQWISF